MESDSQQGHQSDTAELCGLMSRIETEVAESAEREEILCAGRQLQNQLSKADARSLARKWDVRRRIDGKNKLLADMTQELCVNVIKAAKRLLKNKRGAIRETIPTKKLG